MTLPIGTCVFVNEPQTEDTWDYGFQGTITDIKNGYYVIVDMDDDVWDVDFDKVEEI